MTSITAIRSCTADDQYIYAWQTSQSWQGSCRAFTPAFDDGTSETLFVSFR